MIRKATLRDLSSIQNLYTILFERMAELEPNYMQKANQDEAFVTLAIRGEDNFTVFVIEDEGGIQGFALTQLQQSPPYNAFVQQSCMYLLDLVVHPSTRGKGYGKALIQRVKNWGIEKEAAYFELTVLTQNTQAIQLYEREGLRPFSQSMRMRLEE
ncbi:GNAT family N-acetyltransferase [Myroides sp. WP-1]|uniref:GNAT family N-acetyltransferase n=1 Tax=Myroides sp. WP-1 TaxID=2759944 RepID=UPI0015FA3FFA|nr:GNAT family N-acetyltransferase [Myroides sp. WP-1]MBB1137898.1 GNAT family N-acetyltransferase [Myroides sp. WP-1]